MSHIEDAKFFPCPAVVGYGDWEWACGALPGQDCYGRQPTDTNWVHTDRTAMAMHNVMLARRQNRIDEILNQARDDLR